MRLWSLEISRIVNCIFDDENLEARPARFDPESNTRSSIDSMEEYKSRGILAFTINLQGGYPGYEGAINSAFRSDGSLKAGYMNCAAKVIEAADDLGMAIILSFLSTSGSNLT